LTKDGGAQFGREYEERCELASPRHGGDGDLFLPGHIQSGQNPREDVPTDLTMATCPDGTTPEQAEIAKLAALLFGAGQDTSAKTGCFGCSPWH
jgi:hypothetical protein